jgi:hypothetical protein
VTTASDEAELSQLLAQSSAPDPHVVLAWLALTRQFQVDPDLLLVELSQALTKSSSEKGE